MVNCQTCFDIHILPHSGQNVLDHPEREYHKMGPFFLWTFCPDCEASQELVILMGHALTPDAAREWAQEHIRRTNSNG